MQFTNTTIQNRSKKTRLSSEHVIPSHHLDRPDISDFILRMGEINRPKSEILYSIGRALVKGNRNPRLQEFLSSYEFDIVEIGDVPGDAFDLLGSVYQFLNSKHENLEKGSFYTGKETAIDFVRDLTFDQGQVIFDPACGSGVFLFRSDAPPDQLVGVDFDEIAVMIAKFNYFIKYPDADTPKIYHRDFFSWFISNADQRFDYVIGNPPYGASLDLSQIPSRHISSGESFSYFIELGFQLLKEDGVFRFLVPEALLNVKRHSDVRDFILNKTDLKKIKKYQGKFSGVMSDLYGIELGHGASNTLTFSDGTDFEIPKAIFKGLKNQVFVSLNSNDVLITEKVQRLKKHDLSTSIFGLGVVTGDNKSKLFSTPTPDMEHIYTGKEVEKYKLLPPKNFLKFDRTSLQQVAPDEIYRAPQKLVYKTINKHLKLALDETGSLTSNSANILIPAMPGYSIKTVLGFLNSRLYSYLHAKLFGGVNKIAKENLMALPFPDITQEQDELISQLVDQALETGSDQELQDYINRNVFRLTDNEIEYINNFS